MFFKSSVINKHSLGRQLATIYYLGQDTISTYPTHISVGKVRRHKRKKIEETNILPLLKERLETIKVASQKSILLCGMRLLISLVTIFP